MTTQVELAHAIADRGGRPLAEQAGIRLRDTPAPLFQLLCLTILAAKPISASMAADAARQLRRAGMTTPARLLDTTWQQRVDALGRARYRRYDESSATRLAEAATHVRDTWRGDLRRLGADAHGDVDAATASLEDVPGIGPTGARIFLREVQQVWPWVVPYLDDRGRDGAKAVGLPVDHASLCRLTRDVDATRLAAGLVRVTVDDDFRESLPRL